MFNRLPKAICMLSSCSVVGFKSKLDSYLRNIVDSIIVWWEKSADYTRGKTVHGGHYVDDLAAK